MDTSHLHPCKKHLHRKGKIQKKKKKKKEFVLVVLDKMCVFCLYPIPDSQQCVKRGICRHPILSGLLVFVLNLLGLKPICVKQEFGFRSLELICLFRVSIIVYCFRHFRDISFNRVQVFMF